VIPYAEMWSPLFEVEACLRGTTGQRNHRAAAEWIVAALGTDHLSARPGAVSAYTASTSALVAVPAELSRQVQVLAEQVIEGFGRYPDVEIYLSNPDSDRSWVPGACRVR
jgi:hypothetical protein